jgi:7-cyano-7-deazaguanine reductase
MLSEALLSSIMTSLLQQSVGAHAPLGQKSPYPEEYDKSLLHPVSRQEQRAAMGFCTQKFLGFDEWNCFELAWLNSQGMPTRACARIIIPANSPYLPESKSVKLYLHSLNRQKFADKSQVLALIEKDLSDICKIPVKAELDSPYFGYLNSNLDSEYFCLDNLDIKINNYKYNSCLLKADFTQKTQEKVYSQVFKSHCLCTGQPDWGSIFIEYSGPKISHESLLAYLISFHNHQGFSENCIEQIFVDIYNICKPELLSVFGRFSRRGGIEINPYRSNYLDSRPTWRLISQ